MNNMEQDYYIKNTFSKFIEISGQDRANFMQGLITNDINKCDSNTKSIYSCLLSPQGKFLSDFFITNNDNHYLLEIHESYYESFYSKLKIYKLRSKVDFKKNSDLLSFVVFKKDINMLSKETIVYQDPRNDNIGIKIYLDIKSSDLEFIVKLKEFNYVKYKEILIKNLVPHSTTDLVVNQSLLLENNFQNIDAIDWNKGCYVGQEITARMKYRALLKKKIYVLELLSGEINLGDNIIDKGINIGKIVSIVGKYVLCMLRIDFAKNKIMNNGMITIDTSTKMKFL